MKYILFVILLVNNGNNPSSSIAFAEFNDKESCLVAARGLEDMFSSIVITDESGKTVNFDPYVGAANCLPKGKE